MANSQPPISKEMRRTVVEENIQLRVFYRNRDDGQHYLLATWPCNQDDPVWVDAHICGFVRAETAEDAINLFRDRVWRGL